MRDMVRRIQLRAKAELGREVPKTALAVAVTVTAILLPFMLLYKGIRWATGQR